MVRMSEDLQLVSLQIPHPWGQFYFANSLLLPSV